MTKSKEELEEFKSVIENAVLELWAAGTAGATKVKVHNVGWLISLALKPRWTVTLTNVDWRTENDLMAGLNKLVHLTPFGREEMDVYTEWATE